VVDKVGIWKRRKEKKCPNLSCQDHDITKDKLSPDKSEKLFSVMEVDGKIAARGVATACIGNGHNGCRAGIHLPCCFCLGILACDWLVVCSGNDCCAFIHTMSGMRLATFETPIGFREDLLFLICKLGGVYMGLRAS
jgi:hypothetical protein